jgi:hypothetical protein
MPVLHPIILTFQDPAGNPIVGGRADIRLQQDISAATAGGPQVGAGRLISVPIDSQGVAFVNLWPTDTMFPAAVYFVQAYNSLGLLVWSGEMKVTGTAASYILLENGTPILMESGAPNALLTE